MSAPVATPIALDRPMPSRPAARVAQRALLTAALLGVLADPLLRNGLPGLGLVLWIIALASATIALARRHGRQLRAESSAWLAIAVFSAAGAAWRDAPMLQFFDLAAMLSALVLLAMSCNGVPVAGLAFARIRDLIRAGFVTGLDVATGAIPLLLRDAELHAGLRPTRHGNARRIGRAMVITVPMLALFALLLTRADPVFGSYLRFPDIDLGVPFSHVAIAGIFAWIVAGWLRRAFVVRPALPDSSAAPLPLSIGTTDVMLALGALTVLFAVFVTVQIGWLFGGEALVLRTTGLSYANYARHGFFELTGVAALLLAVLLTARALIPTTDLRTLRFYRRLAVPLVLLTGAIMLSAGARMQLYVHYYGISADRLYATAFMIWLAIVFVWLAATVLRGRPRTFAAGLVISGFVVLFALNCLNPDALVARANLARGDAKQPGVAGVDLPYVTTLSADAVPVLVSALIAPIPPVDTAAIHDRCAAAKALLDRWGTPGSGRLAGGWSQWTVARTRAAQAVQDHEGALRQLTCTRPWLAARGVDSVTTAPRSARSSGTAPIP